MTTVSRSVEPRGSILGAFFVMLVLSFVLGIFLPALGPFIAGVVGGAVAKTVPNAITAAILPAIILGVTVWLLSAFLAGLPIIGILFGMGIAAVLVLDMITLLLGAVLGAVLF